MKEEIQTKEAENEITNIEKSENNSIPLDNSSKQEFKGNYPECVLKYYDPSVLLTNSPELKTVNDYYESVTCKIKGIENLLYEVQGYSLAETAKPNKLIVLKGDGRNGKSKIFRPLEKVLNEKCSHEHLEQLSGSKAGSKSTIKRLDRLHIKYYGRPKATKIHK